MQLQEGRQFAPLGVVAPAGDEALDHGDLFGLEASQTASLYLGTAAIQKFKKRRNIVVHIYWLRCAFRHVLQKKSHHREEIRRTKENRPFAKIFCKSRENTHLS